MKRYAITALLVVALTGCSASITSTLDTDRAETEIANGIREQTGLEVTVECPDDVAISAGSTFQCFANSDEAQAVVNVTQDDDEGNISWELESQIEPSAAPAAGVLDETKLEQTIASQIQQQLGETVEVICPPDVPLAAGATSECQLIDAEGTEYTVQITQDDDQGNVSWEVLD